MRGTGPTLCVAHAQQVARDVREPDGPCAPNESWLGGAGRQVTCDVIANPERVAAFLASHRRGMNAP